MNSAKLQKNNTTTWRSYSINYKSQASLASFFTGKYYTSCSLMCESVPLNWTFECAEEEGYQKAKKTWIAKEAEVLEFGMLQKQRDKRACWRVKCSLAMASKTKQRNNTCRYLLSDFTSPYNFSTTPQNVVIVGCISKLSSTRQQLGRLDVLSSLSVAAADAKRAVHKTTKNFIVLNRSRILYTRDSRIDRRLICRNWVISLDDVERAAPILYFTIFNHLAKELLINSWIWCV